MIQKVRINANQGKPHEASLEVCLRRNFSINKSREIFTWYKKYGQMQIKESLTRLVLESAKEYSIKIFHKKLPRNIHLVQKVRANANARKAT